MRPRSKNPKRNAVAVRFDDSALADVEAAAERDKAKISSWVRDAATEKARGLSVGVILSADTPEPEKADGQA
jgi:hypothetical protein